MSNDKDAEDRVNAFLGGMEDDPLLGVTWEDSDNKLDGQDELRGRAVGTRFRKVVKMISDDVNMSAETEGPKAKLRKKYVDVLKRPMLLGGCDDVDETDIAFSMLYEQAPWCREPLNALWRSARNHVKEAPFYFAEPILLYGEPGCGKTFLAQMIAENQNLPLLRLNMAQLTGVFEITGHEKAWSGADVGAPLKLMISKQRANPVVILDEVDKCSRPGGNGGDPQNAILALTDPTGRDQWRCPFLQTEIFMGAINYVMTANDIRKVPAHLRDRCRVFEIKRPVGDDLRQFVETAAEGLHQDIVEHIFKCAVRGDSLRSINRAIRVAREVEDMPLKH